MKYITPEDVDVLNAQTLGEVDAGDCMLSGKVEVYSCKATRQDHAIKPGVLEQWAREDAKSSLGDLNDTSIQNVIFLFISTLNSAFPDHEFSFVSPSRFVYQETSVATEHVNNTMFRRLERTQPGLAETIWRFIERDSLGLDQCEIYRYIPDNSSSLGDDIDSIYYFFFNRRQKRMVFLTCGIYSKLHRHDDAGLVGTYLSPRQESYMDALDDMDDMSPI